MVRDILRQWEAEADLLKSGKHPRRQGLPRAQVLQEECSIRGCIADIERVIDVPNEELSGQPPKNMSNENETTTEQPKPSAVRSSDLLDALATECEKRADEWSGCAVYRDREMCENIETMLRDLAKDIRKVLRG